VGQRGPWRRLGASVISVFPIASSRNGSENGLSAASAFSCKVGFLMIGHRHGFLGLVPGGPIPRATFSAFISNYPDTTRCITQIDPFCDGVMQL